MSDPQAPATSPGVDPQLVALAAEDIDDATAALEGVRLVLAGLADLLRRQAAQIRKEAPQ